MSTARVIGSADRCRAAEELGLVTFALDDIDWEDEFRIFLEERASFSPDGLTGMEANLRFVGPGDHGIEHLCAPHRLAELDLPASQCDRREGALRRYGTARSRVRYDRGFEARMGE